MKTTSCGSIICDLNFSATHLLLLANLAGLQHDSANWSIHPLKFLRDCASVQAEQVATHLLLLANLELDPLRAEMKTELWPQGHLGLLSCSGCRLLS